ncbi:MAG: carbohydrate-binding domain-containing protein [Chloroflexi bacterium]|nr:carbohydrate-binding domain-containing protein [Chloroflexota bacterium]
MRQVVTLFLLATLLAMPAACSGKAAAPTAIVPVVQPVSRSTVAAGVAVSTRQASATPTSPVVVEYDKDDLTVASASQANVSTVKLAGDGISFVGKGAAVKGKVLTISSAGTYSISGKLNDGQIVVDTKDAATVMLVLNGADITNTTSSAIYVANAEKTVITLAEGTQNTVTDGAKYVFPDAKTDEPNAAIFSKDDLTINGSGALTVVANYNNGIASKDDLKITGGNITVNAVNDGIKGRDSIVVKDGTITVKAGGDGLQANNDEDAKKGYVAIEGGTLNITAGMDGIQAETRLMVSGGNITLLTGGGNARKAADSAKGLKAGVALTVTGGVFSVNSGDDALHSNNSITISGGEFLLASADDAIHADATLEVSGGDVRITKSYEGMESNKITINAGTIHLVASDDGINGPSTSSSGGAMQGRPGPGGFESGDSHLTVNGGYIAVNALGDGIDINGAVDMTGGTVIVNGPTSNNNGALDHAGFKITGGFLVAAGSAGMAQAPDTSSTQYSLIYNFASAQAAGTLVHIETKDGKALLTFAPAKTYQSIVISSPEIKNGSTYVVYSGGRATGTVADSLYSDGTYTAGTQVASYTISSIVTGAGAGMGGMPGGRGGTRPTRP